MPSERKLRLRDRDVREAVHRQLIPLLTKDGESRVLDEFSLCAGEVRIDVAVVNGKLHGVEIKSEADTLTRLEKQANLYGKVFDTLTIVCGRNHLASVLDSIPSFWGIYVAEPCDSGRVELHEIRSVSRNQGVCGNALAQLLWRAELLGLLERRSCDAKTLRKPRFQLWSALAELYPIDLLKEEVRLILKSRANWRSDRPQA